MHGAAEMTGNCSGYSRMVPSRYLGPLAPGYLPKHADPNPSEHPSSLGVFLYGPSVDVFSGHNDPCTSKRTRPPLVLCLRCAVSPKPKKKDLSGQRAKRD